jgi:hypothetical protein
MSWKMKHGYVAPDMQAEAAGSEFATMYPNHRGNYLVISTWLANNVRKEFWSNAIDGMTYRWARDEEIANRRVADATEAYELLTHKLGKCT